MKRQSAKKGESLYLTVGPLKYHFDECKHIYHLPWETLYVTIPAEGVLAVRSGNPQEASLN